MSNLIKRTMQAGAAISVLVTISVVANITKSPPSNAFGSVDTCGNYCENYPTGFTRVRLRDWRASENPFENYPDGMTRSRMRDYT